MTVGRRLVELVLVLLVCCAALVWWTSDERVSGPPVRDANDAAQAELALDAALAVRDDFQAAARPAPLQREALVERDVSAASEPKTEGDAQATIVVRFVARETGAPVGALHCAAREISDSGWNAGAIDAVEGGYGEMPHSDDDGIAKLHVPPGSYVVHAVARGVEPQDVGLLLAGETREVVFAVFTEEATAYLRAVDAETRQPIADARVEFERRWDGTETPEPRSGDEDGLFRVEIPTEKLVRGKVEARGYAATEFAIGLGHDSPELALVASMHAGGTLRGRVIDDADAPVGDATILVKGSSIRGNVALHTEDYSSSREWSDLTADSGAFEIVGLPPGQSLEIEVQAGGIPRRQEPLVLAAGEARDVVYRLHAGAIVSGFVFESDGTACRRAPLWLVAGDSERAFHKWEEHEAEARTDDQGRFAFDAVPSGTWRVGPAANSGLAPATEIAQVPPGAHEVEVVLRIPRALVLAGRVVGPDEEPLTVGLTVFGEAGYAAGESELDGSFHLGPFREGTLRVWIDETPAGYARDVWEPRAFVAGDENVVLRVERSGALLVAVPGEAVSGEVLLTTSDRSMQIRSFEAGGTCRFQDLSPGLYTVVARTGRGSVGVVAPVAVVAGDEVECTVLVEPGGLVRVQASADHLGVGAVFLRAEARVDFGMLEEQREFVSKALPSGPIVVQLESVDGEVLAHRTVTVIKGETVGVIFD